MFELLERVSASKKSIWLLLGTALLLRLPHLGGSFWLDEAAQALEVTRPVQEQFNIIEDFQPPLLHLYLFLVQHFSHAEWWLRLWGALLPGLITILFTYKIAAKLCNRSVAFFSALLLVTSSFHIFYSQELRPYALPTMLAVLSWWSLVKHTDKTSLPKFSWQYAVLTFLGLYSSYLYPFLLLSQIVFVMWQQPKMIKSTVFSVSLAVLGFLPWVPVLTMQLAAGEAVRRAIPDWETVVSISQAKSPLLVVAKFIFGVLNVDVNFFFIAVMLAVVGLVGVLVWQVGKHQRKLETWQWLLISWLVIPLMSSWLFSFVIPVVQPKRVLFLLPALYILVSWLVWYAWNKFTKKSWVHLTAGGLMLLLLALNLFSSWSYYTNPLYRRENWRDLHQEITQRFPWEKSIVVFAFPEPFAPWRWYDDGGYPTLATGQLNISHAPDLPNLLKRVADYEYVLVFDYLRDLTDPEDEIPQNLFSLGYEERGVMDYPNIGFVRIYVRAGSATATTSIE